MEKTCEATIYAELEHELHDKIFNTNNGNKGGIVGKAGAVKCKVIGAESQDGPVFVQLKMYAVPKASSTFAFENSNSPQPEVKLHLEKKSDVEKLEVEFSLQNGHKNFILVDASGEDEFEIGTITKHTDQPQQFGRFSTLRFHLGVEVTDMDGMDRQRPFYVVSSLFGEHGARAPNGGKSEKKGNKRAKKQKKEVMEKNKEVVKNCGKTGRNRKQKKKEESCGSTDAKRRKVAPQDQSPKIWYQEVFSEFQFSPEVDESQEVNATGVEPGLSPSPSSPIAHNSSPPSDTSMYSPSSEPYHSPVIQESPLPTCLLTIHDTTFMDLLGGDPTPQLNHPAYSS